MHNLTYARARRKRREKGCDLLFGGDEALLQVEGDEGAQGCGLPGVCPRLDSLEEARSDQLPARIPFALLEHGNYAQNLPKLTQGACNSRLGDLTAYLVHDFSDGQRALFGQ